MTTREEMNDRYRVLYAIVARDASEVVALDVFTRADGQPITEATVRAGMIAAGRLQG